MPEITKTTTFEDLPKDVIQSLIISKLSLRDVVNFSSVSKNWTHVPSCLQKISLKVNMFKNGIPPEEGGKDAFVRGVNQFLKHYSKLRSIAAAPVVSLRKLSLRCYLGRDSSDDIDAWISMAFCNGVSNLSIYFDCERHLADTSIIKLVLKLDEMYIFPWQMLDKQQQQQQQPIVLNKLYLRYCIFECRHLTSVWTSLEILQLSCVVITQNDVDRIGYCFPNLKSFSLGCSKVPKKLTFCVSSLSCLVLLYCNNLKEIEVLDDAGMLEEFRYRGSSVVLKIANPHRLTKLTFGIMNSEGVDYVFQNLRRDFPALTSLALYTDCKTLPSVEHLYGQMYSFRQLEELKLYTHPNVGFSLQITGEILKSCPALRRLEMISPCTVDVGNVPYPPHPNKSLEFIKISGFCGSPGNMELAKFLIQTSKASSLHLVIKRKVETNSYYVYSKEEHNESWHGEQEFQVTKETLRGLMKGRGGELVFS